MTKYFLGMESKNDIVFYFLWCVCASRTHWHHKSTTLQRVNWTWFWGWRTHARTLPWFSSFHYFNSFKLFNFQSLTNILFYFLSYLVLIFILFHLVLIFWQPKKKKKAGKLQCIEELNYNEEKKLKVFQADPFDYHSLVNALKGCSGLFYSFEPPSDHSTYDVTTFPLLLPFFFFLIFIIASLTFYIIKNISINKLLDYKMTNNKTWLDFPESRN